MEKLKYLGGVLMIFTFLNGLIALGLFWYINSQFDALKTDIVLENNRRLFTLENLASKFSGYELKLGDLDITVNKALGEAQACFK